MKKIAVIILLFFISQVAFSQANNYSIYIKLYNLNKFKNLYSNYDVFFYKNNDVSLIKDKKYFRFQFESNMNLKLQIKKRKKIIFEIDSIQKFYINDCNTVYLYIGLNEDAKKDSYRGEFIKTDMSKLEDLFCNNCDEYECHIVEVRCSKCEFKF